MGENWNCSINISFYDLWLWVIDSFILILKKPLIMVQKSWGWRKNCKTKLFQSFELDVKMEEERTINILTIIEKKKSGSSLTIVSSVSRQINKMCEWKMDFAFAIANADLISGQFNLIIKPPQHCCQKIVFSF